jgi:hypothetical protein
MRRYLKPAFLLILTAWILSGCGLKTVEQLYCLPERSEADQDLQAVIDDAMDGLTFSVPMYGDNRLNVQAADLDGDGVVEYLAFATDHSEKPLKILIFCQLASGYVLMDTIEGYGFAFDFVEYAQLDDRPGLEIIVGRQVSDQVARAVSVYRFSSGISKQLLSVGYSRLSTCDLDQDGKKEIFLLNYGAAENGSGLVTLYSYQEGEMQRSSEQPISSAASDFERFTSGTLEDGRPAMFVTCEKDDMTLVSDVFVMNEGNIHPVVKGISTKPLQGYRVYPFDVDGDGITEMARLLPMPNTGGAKQQYLLQWYSLDEKGTETEKRYTFHHYADGWYVTVNKDIIDKLAVEQTEEVTTFCLFENGKRTPLVSVQALTDKDREEQAKQDGRVILYKGNAVIYTAIIEEKTQEMGLTKEILQEAFYPIRAELMTEED